MPRVEIPLTTLSGLVAGVASSVDTANSDATNDHVLSNIHKGMWLEITNTIASPATVTFVTPGTAKGRAIADDAPTIGASEVRRRFGPFDPAVYGEDLQVDVTVTTLSLRAYQLAPDF